MPVQILPPSHTSGEPPPTAAISHPPAADPPVAGDNNGANSHKQHQHDPDSDGQDRSTSSHNSDEDNEYILVQLEDISKEVQCPICLGIIRKTRIVKECLHRFCRECIDKAMRIGNNECPACRTHCASRRSLRDDPNFDALIAALYPDIDFDCLIEALYPEDKFAEEIQASIDKTLRQRSDSVGQRRSMPKATAAAFMRRSQPSYRSGKNSYYRRQGRASVRNSSPVLSDYDEEEDVNGNDSIKVSSSEELSPDRMHKRRRMLVPRSSPARLDVGLENYDTEMNRENVRRSPLRAASKELSWGKGGVRSQTRHSNNGGSNGRFVRATRLTKLIEYLHNLDENEDKFDIHLKLLPLNEQSKPLESPYLCCSPTLYIRHLRQFIAIQTSGQVEGVDLFVRKPQSLISQPSNQAEEVTSDVSEEMQILGAEESLACLLTSFTSSEADLELLYRISLRKDM